MTRPATVVKVDRRRYVMPSVGELELRETMKQCHWQASVAAQYLGVHRSTVYRLLQRYGMEKE